MVWIVLFYWFDLASRYFFGGGYHIAMVYFKVFLTVH